jgi:hypothetical protein
MFGIRIVTTYSSTVNSQMHCKDRKLVDSIRTHFKEKFHIYQYELPLSLHFQYTGRYRFKQLQ